jgi:hypothetical protein
MANTTEYLYWLASLVSRPNAVTAGGVTTYTLRINQYGKDERASYSIEMGNEDGQSRFANARLTAMTLTLYENKAPTFTGTLFGGKYEEDGVVLTASPTRIPTAPVGPKKVSVYIATTAAGLNAGGAKLNNGMLLDCSLTIGDMAEQVYGIEDVESFSGVVEKKPSVVMKMTFEQNSRAIAWMANLRAGTIMYARIRLGGPTIGGQPSSIDFDFPFQFREPDRGETRNVLSGSLDCRACYDGEGAGKLGSPVRNPPNSPRPRRSRRL